MEKKELIKYAIKAQERANAKFSNYKVGAALLLDSGDVILGCNIESKAYPTTICAERVAIFSALAQGLTKFCAMAIVTSDGATPCGGCRQIIYEYAPGINIIISDMNMNYFETNPEKLLPHPFG